MEIHHHHLSIDTIAACIASGEKLSLSAQAVKAVQDCRAYLDAKMQDHGKKYYGINTGFGSLCDVEISPSDVEQLQENLVMSHACGTGEELPLPIVKIMLLLKIQSLCYGHSGVSLATVERLLQFYNEDILPVIYTQGSLGASGDLSPLAHLSLPLLGKGEVFYKGKRMPAAQVLELFSWQALRLQSKEGLALLNGTQFMLAYGVYLVIQGKKLWQQANYIAAASLDAFACKLEPFHPLVHKIRAHKGQVETAAQILDLLSDSPMAQSPKPQVQDPYSFRCIPQVHGASKDTLDYVSSVFTTELNSVTDNPNVFPEEDLIISAGNFHGQPLALALDFLKLALAELGSISERRVYLLVSGTRNLPPYLSPQSGLHSGFMIPQYTAASIVSKNKQLCTPASADSIPSSNGQEDHVSMGANAAVQCYEILKNVESILAIEWMNAAQALDFRAPQKSASAIEKLKQAYRQVVPQLTEDRVLYPDIQASKTFLAQYFA